MKAIIKFNNGLGALLCSSCSVIIRTGFEHDVHKAHYCDECEGIRMHKGIELWKEHKEAERKAMNLQRMDSKKEIEGLKAKIAELKETIRSLKSGSFYIDQSDEIDELKAKLEARTREVDAWIVRFDNKVNAFTEAKAQIKADAIREMLEEFKSEILDYEDWIIEYFADYADNLEQE